MLEALTHSLGVVAPACQMAGISRNTHYNWLKDDAGYREEVANINESRFRFVETKLLENGSSRIGNDVAQIFTPKPR
jgi:predicted site-specific integrase-resolvase